MAGFDWHSDRLVRDTPVTANYKNTRNIRRVLRPECGADFKLDRAFMAWIMVGQPKTMGDVANEWRKRRG